MATTTDHGHSLYKNGCRCAVCKEGMRAYQRSRMLARKYGMTEADRDALIASQGGVCAICATLAPQGGVLHIDHSHTTGEVRGALCVACNTGIGQLKDDPGLLRKAAEYLERTLTER